MQKIKNFSRQPMDACDFHLTEAKNYKRFLNKVFHYADTICMTYSGGYDDFKKSEWSFLNTSVIGYEMTNQTAVTQSHLTVCLIYCKIDPVTTKWLKEKDHIYDFPGYEEWFDDLCFVKNGEVVFASCTHEAFCYINQELAERMR